MFSRLEGADPQLSKLIHSSLDMDRLDYLLRDSRAAGVPYGEIDLVARRRNLVAFIEVKARASLDEAAYAVTPRQQARIIEAAQAWLMAHPEHAELDLRFDAMLIAPRRLPRHLLAAFDAST